MPGAIVALKPLSKGSLALNSREPRVICNSVPRAGACLLLEIAKAAGYRDAGIEISPDGLRHIRNGVVGPQHPMPRAQSVEQIPLGAAAPAHLPYTNELENRLLSSSNRMLFIVRDPRDLVVSWVDFTYHSKAFTGANPENALARREGLRSNPVDASRIMSSIDGLLKCGMERFAPWLESPACHSVRFEDLHPELTRRARPVMDSLLDYLGARLEGLPAKGRTWSPRWIKVGVYRYRMNADHLRRISRPDFRRLMALFGYEE